MIFPGGEKRKKREENWQPNRITLTGNPRFRSLKLTPLHVLWMGKGATFGTFFFFFCKVYIISYLYLELQACGATGLLLPVQWPESPQSSSSPGPLWEGEGEGGGSRSTAARPPDRGLAVPQGSVGHVQHIGHMRSRRRWWGSRDEIHEHYQSIYIY